MSHFHLKKVGQTQQMILDARSKQTLITMTLSEIEDRTTFPDYG